MSVLQALDRYYGRMEARHQAGSPGFSREKISFVIELSPTGEPVSARDLREMQGKRLVPRLLSVPAAVKRTVAVLPNTLWDKSAYVLGRTAGEGRRTTEEHAAFRAKHLEFLAGTDDPGLVALRRFLERWTPERFDQPPFAPEMLDANLVFRLEGDNEYLHERAAARALLAAQVGDPQRSVFFCLITGLKAPVQRLHPTIKGVAGAQSSGASLVSFNLDAFCSYGKEQGDNAPTSEAAAFRYGAALNAMLDRASRNRLQRGIGDATVVFWADASGAGEEAAEAAETAFAGWVEPPDDAGEAATLHDALVAVAAGRPNPAVTPNLDLKTRFHVLGLAPNAARLSVRFWLTDDFGAFARRLAEHQRDLSIAPPPRGWKGQPSVQRLLVRTTALQEKFENIPPLLAGEVMRAVLGGTPYPRTLLTAAITRLRAGDDPGSGWHAAVIKAVINRSDREEIPVALEADSNNAAYQLGRLFALLEAAQYAALGRVNATIADRYYGAASSTPSRVFGALLRGLRTHLSDARKRNRGGWIEPRIVEVMRQLPADLPRTLRLEDQGRFAVGYYHERATRPTKDAEANETEGETDER